MPTFTFFNDRLPDPTFTVNDAGAVEANSKKGPGFASVRVASNRPVQVSRTMSGRGIHRESGAHHWEISITYNPMTREDFDTVSSFLDARNGRMNPFYVVLPQYSRPKDVAFHSFVLSNAIRVFGAHTAGRSSINMYAASNIAGTPRPGDYFTIADGADINHRKAYKVTRVETNTTYQVGSTRPTTTQVRVHIMPPLVRNVSNNATITWIDPLFRVIQKEEVTEHELNNDNLYQFQLALEEILA